MDFRMSTSLNCRACLLKGPRCIKKTKITPCLKWHTARFLNVRIQKATIFYPIGVRNVKIMDMVWISTAECRKNLSYRFQVTFIVKSKAVNTQKHISLWGTNVEFVILMDMGLTSARISFRPRVTL